MIADILAEVRTEHILNREVKHCNYAKLLSAVGLGSKVIQV
jgi:hypothetical protein